MKIKLKTIFIIGAIFASMNSFASESANAVEDSFQYFKNLIKVDTRTSKESGRLVVYDQEKFIESMKKLEHDKNKSFVDKEKEIIRIRLEQEKRFIESENRKLALEKQKQENNLRKIQEEKDRLKIEEIEKLRLAEEADKRRVDEANAQKAEYKRIQEAILDEKIKEEALIREKADLLRAETKSKLANSKDLEQEIKTLREDMAIQKKEMEVTKKMLEKFQKSQAESGDRVEPVEAKAKLKIY